MNVRTFLNSNPWITGIVVVVVAAGALWFSVRTSSSGRSGAPSKTYFTTDEGQTWFGGNPFDYPPFMKDGKEAVRAYVYQCNGKEFVGYLERYNRQSRPAMDEAAAAARQKRPPKNLDAIIEANRSGTEVKRPGDKEWTAGAPGPKTQAVRNVTCKDGSEATAVNFE